MELSLRTSLDAQVEGDGAVVVRAGCCVDIVAPAARREVTIEHRADESVVHVTCGPASYRLHTYAAEDFPRLPEIDAAPLQHGRRDALLETIAASAAPRRATSRGRC